MASNHDVVYLGRGKVEVQSIDYPALVTPRGRKIEHGVIVRPVTTNICGSDQHMVRGRTTAPVGLVLGHEITGEVIECGRDVEFIRKGHVVSVPFNVACGLSEGGTSAKDEEARTGNLSMRLGLGWAKSHALFTGQTPVMRYHRGLMMAILHDRIKIAQAVNVEVIPLDQAPAAYAAFDAGVARKFVIDPHHVLDARLGRTAAPHGAERTARHAEL